MKVFIIKEGKEQGQGVGYLDDGTMIVVEGASRFMEHELSVTVTRVLQTVAGRMIFAQPRDGIPAENEPTPMRARGHDTAPAEAAPRRSTGRRERG